RDPRGRPAVRDAPAHHVVVPVGARDRGVHRRGAARRPAPRTLAPAGGGRGRESRLRAHAPRVGRRGGRRLRPRVRARPQALGPHPRALSWAGTGTRPDRLTARGPATKESRMTRSFGLTFDYRCPFARNGHEAAVNALREGADLDVTFVPFS